MECRKQKKREWYVRLSEELKRHKGALFLTLTFNEDMYEETRKAVNAGIQPMGIQMALQAQEVMANTQLANAQAEKTRAEATAQNMQNLIGSSIDLAQKIAEIGRTKQEKKNLEATYDKTKKEVEKVQEEVNNLMLQGDVLKRTKNCFSSRTKRTGL